MGAKKSKLSDKAVKELADKTKCESYNHGRVSHTYDSLYSVTPVEIKHWHEGFMKDCPTGRLTRGEFSKIYNQFFPSGDPSAFAQ